MQSAVPHASPILSALPVVLLAILALAGCATPDPRAGYDLEGTPDLALELTGIRPDNGTVHALARVHNRGDADAFLTPFHFCGNGGLLHVWDGDQPAPMVPEDWEVACGRALMQDHHLVRVPAGGTYEQQAQAGTYLLEAGKTYTLGASWHSQRRGGDTFTLPLWEGVLASERIPFVA